VRRFFFLLLFSNLAYGAWAALVRPPPTVPVNQAFARLAPLKLVDELPPSERPDPAARKTADTPGQCLSVGPFGDVDNSAKAAALLRARGFDPKQRAAEGEMTQSWWVFIGGMKAEGDTDHALVILERNGVKDAIVMPATADVGRRVSLGLFTERARAERRAESVRAMGLKAEVAERKLANALYWVDLAPQPGMNTIPLQDLFSQGVSTKVSVQPCPPAAAAALAIPATPGPAPATAASTPSAAVSGPPRLP